GTRSGGCGSGRAVILRIFVGWHFLQLLFGIATQGQLVAGSIDFVKGDGDGVFANADKAADAQNNVSHLTVGRHHKILDVTHFLVVLVIDRFSFEFGVKAFTTRRIGRGAGA